MRQQALKSQFRSHYEQALGGQLNALIQTTMKHNAIESKWLEADNVESRWKLSALMVKDSIEEWNSVGLHPWNRLGDKPSLLDWILERKTPALRILPFWSYYAEAPEGNLTTEQKEAFKVYQKNEWQEHVKTMMQNPITPQQTKQKVVELIWSGKMQWEPWALWESKNDLESQRDSLAWLKTVASVILNIKEDEEFQKQTNALEAFLKSKTQKTDWTMFWSDSLLEKMPLKFPIAPPLLILIMHLDQSVSRIQTPRERLKKANRVGVMIEMLGKITPEHYNIPSELGARDWVFKVFERPEYPSGLAVKIETMWLSSQVKADSLPQEPRKRKRL